jgi:hypothetical protein
LSRTHNARGERTRSGSTVAVVGGSIAILVAVVIIVVARPSGPYESLVFGLPLLGGVLALLRPRSWVAQVVAIPLILFGAGQVLISGVGILYLPSILLLAVAAGKLATKDVTKSSSKEASRHDPR